MTRTLIACVCFASLLAALKTTKVEGAPLVWSVDTAQSFLSLSMPTQPVSLGGTPSGNAFYRNQGASSGSWTVGNQAPIAGSIATDFIDGSLIKFYRDGVLTSQNDNSRFLNEDFNFVFNVAVGGNLGGDTSWFNGDDDWAAMEIDWAAHEHWW